MIFKKNWERSTELFTVPAAVIDGIVKQAMPHNRLLSYEFISEGCSNLSVKIQIDEPETPPLILRIYFANQEGPFMERLSHRLLGKSIPIPCIHYIGRYENYQFAIAQFLPGKPLRDFLVSKNKSDEMEKLMFAVGVVLGQIANFQFPQSGIFNRDLLFIEGSSQEGYLHCVEQLLKEEAIAIHFRTPLLLKIQRFAEKNKPLFPTAKERCFVHGDFDPNNILVDQIEGTWKVTGVLDWETPFSGSVLCDVSNMLRYRRHISAIFENSFLGGLRYMGVQIPSDWAQRVDLLNLLALLSCLAKTNPEKSPRQCKDICNLLAEIVE